MKRYWIGIILGMAVYFAIAFYGRAMFNIRCESSNGVTVQAYGRLICLIDQPVIAEQ